MLKLTFIVHVFVASIFVAIGMVIALVAGWDGSRSIITAAALGFVLAFPASWLGAKMITRLTDTDK